MTAKRFDGSSDIDLTTQKRWDGSAWVDLTTGKRWDGSAWQDVLSGGGGGPVSVTASPGTARGTVIDMSSPPLSAGVSSNIVTANATGGVPPYTYNWHKISGDTVTITAPTSDSTQFSATLFRNESRTATYRCTVTDSVGTFISVNVSVFLHYVTS